MANRILTDSSSDFASIGRYKFIRYFIYAISFFFILRLSQLQLLQGNKYSVVSEAQAIKRVRVEPFRGNIFDRNNALIVHNEPSFAITLTPYSFKKYAMPLLSSILQMDSASIYKIVDRYIIYSRFNPIKIARDADFEKVSLIEEYSDYLPGIEVNIESKRLYELDANMAHVLGYTREITKSQIEKYNYYHPGDQIGQNGIEKSYERDLRGREGIQYIAVNKLGQKVESFDNGSNDIPTKNGFDLYLGIDKRMQELAEKLLKGQRGCVVAINPKDGSIYAMASKPDYDPRTFSGKIPAELYKELSTDKSFPLQHRAIMSQYPPGSTWKMLIAIAALNEGIINENTTMNCGGGIEFGGKFRKCHGNHGTVNVRKAIQTSCNSFFYQLGLKIGMDVFEKYGKMFGFGSKTNIDLPGEASGVLPTQNWLEARLGKGNFWGRMVNYGIGQGEILVTPLQMASYTATIANEGNFFQPHLVDYIRNNITNKKEQLSIFSNHLPIDHHVFEIVKDGMYNAVNLGGGTASAAKLTDIQVCGKTGTAQNSQGRDHSWFVCFAPKENPQIAMAVFVENAGFGGAVAAPIAQKILDAFFHNEKYEEFKNPNKIIIPIDTTQTNSNQQQNIPD
ncbi:MAG: penicillin-binding protein 2 [Candidatus Gastranaerophilaceae bacterium]|jgi:penicillin-binding protein 2